MLFFRKDVKKDSKALADSFFTKGQWISALDAYEEALAASPQDVKILRRVADLRAKLGKTAGAVEAYRKTADILAASGFLLQAIAIYKILLRLDPKAEDVGKKLGELYAERGIPTMREEQKGVSTPEAEDELTISLEEEPQPAQAAHLPVIPLFSDLPREVFAKVLEKLVAHQLEAGQYLFREGDPGDSIFIVTGGTVDVFTKDKPLATLSEGEFFGEGAYFSGKPRNADVRAGADHAEVLEIRRDDLNELTEDYSVVRDALKTFYRKRVVERLLAVSAMMTELDERARAEIERILVEVRVHQGEKLVEEGSRERTLYFVVKGKFGVTTIHPVTGEVVQIGEIEPGQFFGEVSLITSAERTATVTALEDSEVMKVTAETLEPVMERYPDIRRALERARDERAAATVDVILGRKKR